MKLVDISQNFQISILMMILLTISIGMVSLDEEQVKQMEYWLVPFTFHLYMYNA